MGNPLRGDDGIGLAVAREAARRLQGQGVPVVHFEAGGDPLALLAELERIERAVIVDAAEMGEPAGTVRVLPPERAIAAIRRDPLLAHGFGLGEVLRLAAAAGILPREVSIVGIQPARTELGEQLSPVLRQQLPEYVDITCEEVLG